MKEPVKDFAEIQTDAAWWQEFHHKAKRLRQNPLGVDQYRRMAELLETCLHEEQARIAAETTRLRTLAEEIRSSEN